MDTGANQLSTGIPKVPWKRLVKPYRRSDTRRSLAQVVVTSALFLLVWWLMLESLSQPYWTTLSLSLVGGLLTVRLFGFFHDCVHDSFFPSPAANRLVGRILGVLTLTPFRYWQKTHLLHHAGSGNLDRRGFGDVDTLTVEEYLAKTRFQRFCYRVGRNPLVFLTVGPVYQFVLKHRLPLDMPRSWKREWASVLLNNVALVLTVLAVSSLVGFQNFLAVQIPLFVVSTTAGIWLFFVQHQFPETYWEQNENWDYSQACLQGSSYLDLPQPLRWFTASIGVHHIHHLCSAIPNYRLQQCWEDLREHLPARRMTLWQSFRCGRLTLWDGERRRLIGLRELAPARSAPLRADSVSGQASTSRRRKLAQPSSVVTSRVKSGTATAKRASPVSR